MRQKSKGAQRGARPSAKPVAAATHGPAVAVPAAPPAAVPEDPRAALSAQAEDCLSRGELAQAEALCRKGLSFGPDAALECILGKSVVQQGRRTEAMACFERAMALSQPPAKAWLESAYASGRMLLNAGRVKDAVERLKRTLQADPSNSDHWRFCGLALRRQGSLREAAECLRKAHDMAPDHLDTVVDYAWFLEEAGQHARALEIAVAALEKFGAIPRLIRLRAVLERRQGRHQSLIAWLREEIKKNDAEVSLWREIAHTVAAVDAARSIPLFREVVKRTPKDFEAIVNLANHLNRARGKEEAKNIEESYQLALKALSLEQNPISMSKELHGILVRMVDFEKLESLGSFNELCTNWANRNLVTALHGMMGQVVTPEQRIHLMECHKICGDKIEDVARLTPLPARPAVTGRAKIRIGFMSSDLRNHPVAYFAWPLLQNMDRSKFEIYCYSWATSGPDQVQTMIASHVDVFRHEPVIGNRNAAALIAGDDLDILFELGGTTHMNKLDVMSWRPAPRQASWLGYPHSAGLKSIDRLLVDPYTRPAFPNLMMETPFQLERSWVCLTAPGFGDLPEIAEKMPEARKGFVTFGTANNPYKFNPDLLRTWAQIMRAVPGSRLLFIRPEGGTPSFRRNLSRFFEAEGVEAKRLLFVPVRGDHLRYYNEIDISLDTFPQTGGTTTCETLFMGVPVVSLAGNALFERLSYSNLVNAGWPELVTFSKQAYVDLAIKLANDKPWREYFRKTVRQRISENPLGRADLFARDFEKAALAWMDDRI